MYKEKSWDLNSGQLEFLSSIWIFLLVPERSSSKAGGGSKIESGLSLGVGGAGEFSSPCFILAPSP
jgi:hypothetical protein